MINKLTIQRTPVDRAIFENCTWIILTIEFTGYLETQINGSLIFPCIKLNSSIILTYLYCRRYIHLSSNNIVYCLSTICVLLRESKELK